MAQDQHETGLTALEAAEEKITHLKELEAELEAEARRLLSILLENAGIGRVSVCEN